MTLSEVLEVFGEKSCIKINIFSNVKKNIYSEIEIFFNGKWIKPTVLLKFLKGS